jgi:hypothetical protein
MDHENNHPLKPVLQRFDLEIGYLKREMADTPKGPRLYTYAQLVQAKISMLQEAKSIIIANTPQP